MDDQEHYCDSPTEFPLSKFLQHGKGAGKHILIVGESPAPNGWRKSGKAFYSPDNKLLPSGVRLNELLKLLELDIETCAFTELIKCHTAKDRKKLNSCAEKCWDIFTAQIEIIDPKLILLLGLNTLRILNNITGHEYQLGKLEQFKVNHKVYNLLAIYHPSPINPHGRQKNEIIFSKNLKDIKLVAKLS